ncbi:MAG: hypothetical protein AB7E72_18460 [Lysobacterales bacterium]
MTLARTNLIIGSIMTILPVVAGAEPVYQCITDSTPFAAGAGGQGMIVESTTSSGGAYFVTYINPGNHALMLKRCDDTRCTSSTEQQLLSDVQTLSTDLDISLQQPGNRPVISVTDNRAPSIGIRLVLCSDEQCSAHSVREVSNTVGLQAYIHPTVAVSEGRPHVAYYNRQLELYSCADFSCPSASLRIADATVNSGFYVSAADYGGAPLFAYTENARTPAALKLYRCNDASCASGTLTQIDTLPFLILYTELSLRDNAVPVVGFSSFETLGPNHDEHYIYTCANESCSSGLRSPPVAAPGAIRTTAIGVRSNGHPFATFASIADASIYFRQCLDQMCANSHVNIVSPYAGSVAHALTISGDGTAIVLHGATNGVDIALTRCTQLPEDLFRDGFEQIQSIE